MLIRILTLLAVSFSLSQGMAQTQTLPDAVSEAIQEAVKGRNLRKAGIGCEMVQSMDSEKEKRKCRIIQFEAPPYGVTEYQANGASADRLIKVLLASKVGKVTRANDADGSAYTAVQIQSVSCDFSSGATCFLP